MQHIIEILVENLTTIIALITALAAVIVPVVTAIITERWRAKQKALELLFNEKLTAYREFLHYSGLFFDNPLNNESMNNLRRTMDRARLLASPETDAAICAFISLLFAVEPPAYSFNQMEEISRAHEKVVVYIRAELSAYDLYKRKSRHAKVRNKQDVQNYHDQNP